jgi:catechol 2,3-dioxygenase-like lactoylglutathione lyase family enzyme
MKRFHIHVAVDDIGQSTRFYSNLFGAEPAVLKDDYEATHYGEDEPGAALAAKPQTACCAPVTTIKAPTAAATSCC